MHSRHIEGWVVQGLPGIISDSCLGNSVASLSPLLFVGESLMSDPPLLAATQLDFFARAPASPKSLRPVRSRSRNCNTSTICQKATSRQQSNSPPWLDPSCCMLDRELLRLSTETTRLPQLESSITVMSNNSDKHSRRPVCFSLQRGVSNSNTALS